MKSGALLLSEYLNSLKPLVGYEWLNKYNITSYNSKVRDYYTILILNVSLEQPALYGDGISYSNGYCNIFITGNHKDMQGGLDNSVLVEEDCAKLYELLHNKATLGDYIFNNISTMPTFFKIDENQNLVNNMTTEFKFRKEA